MVIVMLMIPSPGADSFSGKVSETISKNLELLEAITTKLDKGSSTPKCWWHLGHKLLGSKYNDRLNDCKSATNPAKTLMFFIYESHNPGITVVEFKSKIEAFSGIEKKDILEVLPKTGKQAPYIS